MRGLVVAVMSFVGWMVSIPIAGFATGAIGGIGSLTVLADEVRKAMQTSKYDWLDIVKGLCEV